jgi:hypothetical protein
MAENKVVGFPQPEIAPEERARRLRVEADRLARLPIVKIFLRGRREVSMQAVYVVYVFFVNFFGVRHV